MQRHLGALKKSMPTMRKTVSDKTDVKQYRVTILNYLPEHLLKDDENICIYISI